MKRSVAAMALLSLLVLALLAGCSRSEASSGSPHAYVLSGTYGSTLEHRDAENDITYGKLDVKLDLPSTGLRPEDVYSGSDVLFLGDPVK